jgi:alkanesulfonate monooxygenase SsuD/methylene tetrahydromethanopterin reductase-like flavin-dependent oxidoreductase (luciferase family)
MVVTGVDEEALQPGIEGTGVTQTPELAPALDEGVLHGIVRGIPIAEDPRRDRVQAMVCGGREPIECLVVAPLCAFDEFGRHRRPLGCGAVPCRTHRLDVRGATDSSLPGESRSTWPSDYLTTERVTTKEMPVPEVRLGALCWNQYTDWPSLLDAGRRAEALGYDDLWTWDHLYPIVGSSAGPILEGYMVMAGWAMATQRIRIGLMVGANTFREPSVVAKMITTLDHISNGRAILGIGAAWFEEEHRAYGLEYGDGPPDRLRWLREALPIMRGMLDGSEPTATGPRYSSRGTRNLPPPIQDHLPIVVGGSGPRVTMRLAAEYGDMNNFGGTPDEVRAKEALFREHLAAVGRDLASVERTTGVGTVFIRDSREEAQRVFEETFAYNGGARPWRNQPVGTPEDVAAHLAPYVEAGYRHLIAGRPAPYDEESMVRLVTEVKPMLERVETDQGRSPGLAAPTG